MNIRGRNSVVECQLPKLDVAGSNPVARCDLWPHANRMPTAKLNLQQAMNSAIAHHQAGRLTEAQGIYQQILAQDPAHPDALHLLGVIAHQAGRHDAAIDLINKAIARRPDDAAYYSNQGEAYRAMGRLDEAIAAYQQALALNPNYAEAHNNLGTALYAKGQLTEAIDA